MSTTADSPTFGDGGTPLALWGPVRHKKIAADADKLLTEKAKTAVSAILAPVGQNSLAEIATWADEIKGGGPKDPDTLQFLKDFPGMVHKNWHFVDLPTGVTGYDRKKYPEFTNDSDVVQTIGKSVDVLQGNSNFVSKINALRWLTHLVGDLHQPLHVACTYLNFNDKEPALLSDPDEIIKQGAAVKSDQGGNNLLLPIKDDPTFHSYWDSLIPSASPEEIAVNIPPVVAPNGPPNRWAETWALDAILKSREAYKTLKSADKVKNKFHVSWEGKEAYDKRCSVFVGEQIILGGQRLALIVNTIFV